MSTRVFALAAVAGFALAAHAASIPLVNADFELDAGTGYKPTIQHWVGGAGFDHAAAPRPGNETLGQRFGFLGGGPVWGCYQKTGVTIQPNTIYTFDSFIYITRTPENPLGGALPLAVGYIGEGNQAYVLSATLNAVGTGGWFQAAGASYTTGAAGPEIGYELIVGYAGINYGLDEGDTWFDNASATATAVPEPAALVLLLGLVALRRR